MNIKFNVGKTYQKANDNMNVLGLDEITVNPNTEKTDLPYLQNFNNGKRINGSNMNWEYWNGIVYVDIDSKHYYNEVRKFDVNKLTDFLHNVMYDDTNFYAMQLSHSNTSLHILFYYDVPVKNANAYKCCVNNAISKTKSYFTQINAQEIIEYNNVLDKCTGSPYQGMFVSSNKWYFGLDCHGNCDNIDFNVKDELINQSSDNFIISSENYKSTDEVIDKVCIDRNLFINSYSGNEIRWRISLIADTLFGDDGKRWCDKYFYYDNNKSIYNKTHGHINNTILNWLIDKGYIKEIIDNIKSDISINVNKGEWLSDHTDEITDYIDKHNKVELFAGTGIGKTTLINGEDKREIFFNIPKKGLAELYNAIVIVPYNTTNKLYNHLVEISSSTQNKIGDYPCVMNFDQAVKHWFEIQDRNIIIDEAHTLFTEQTFRDKAIKLINHLQKEHSGKLICVTATPTGEIDMLDLKIIEVKNKKQPVQMAFIQTDNIAYAQYGIIHDCFNKFDKIVLMCDNTAERVYQNLIANNICDLNDICYIRADKKDTEDYINLLQNEILTKKITICTRVAYNGINFKNKNEKVLIVSAYIPENNIAAEYIQIAGRFRNSNVQMIVTFKDLANMSEDYEGFEMKMRRYNIIKNNAAEFNITDTLINYDDRCDDENYVNAQKSVLNYIIEHGAYLNQVIRELKSYSYISAVIADKNIITHNKLDLEFKKDESNNFKRYIKNNDNWFDKMTTDYNENTNKYIPDWTREIKILADKYNKETILALIETMIKKDNILIETIIDKLCEISRITSKTLDQYSVNLLLNHI